MDAGCDEGEGRDRIDIHFLSNYTGIIEIASKVIYT